MVARTLSDLGGLAILEEDYARAIELYDETIPSFRESGDRRALSVTLSNLAALHGLQGDEQLAHEVGLEALAIAREHRDHDQMTISLHNLGRYALAREAWDEAGAFFAESLDLARGLGYRELLANCLLGVGELAVTEGDLRAACRLLGAGAALFAELGVQPGPEEQEGEQRALEQLRGQLGPDELERGLQAGRQLAWSDAVQEAVELARGVGAR
jgi:tetratricopeptide (TPR) repeat protein